QGPPAWLRQCAFAVSVCSTTTSTPRRQAPPTPPAAPLVAGRWPAGRQTSRTAAPAGSAGHSSSGLMIVAIAMVSALGGLRLALATHHAPKWPDDDEQQRGADGGQQAPQGPKQAETGAGADIGHRGRDRTNEQGQC